MRSPTPKTSRSKRSALGKTLDWAGSRTRRAASSSAALRAGSRARWKEKNRQFAHAAALTATLNPYQVLARGYAMVAGPDGTVRQAGQLAAGQTIRLIAAHRRAECLVTAVEETDESTQDI